MASIDQYLNQELISPQFTPLEQLYGSFTGGNTFMANNQRYRVEDTGRGTRIVRLDATAEQIAQEAKQSVMNKFLQMVEQQGKNVDEYIKNNPFALDDAWYETTRAQLKDEVNSDPYYKEKLSNYLQDVDIQKQQAGEDTAQLLKELDRQENVYQQSERTQFQQARDAALEGQSQAGTLTTGAGSRDRNIQNINRQASLEDYGARKDLRAQQAQQAQSRLLSGLDLQTSRFKTDLEREKALNIETGVQQRAAEQNDRYKAGLEKASGQILPGYQTYLGGIT